MKQDWKSHLNSTKWILGEYSHHYALTMSDTLGDLKNQQARYTSTK